jgi:5-methylcytosine-specific restriction endonuclease McrA
MTARDPRYQTVTWQRLRQWVLDRDGWVCQVRDKGCTHGATTVDHIAATVEGGDFWSPANLRASCRHCNSVRGARLARRYRVSTARYVTRF